MQLMGLAMYNSIILDMTFPPCCFKKLLTPPTYSEPDFKGTAKDGSSSATSVGVVKFSLSDLATVMPVSSQSVVIVLILLFSKKIIARSLKYLQDYDGEVEDLCYTFQVLILTPIIPSDTIHFSLHRCPTKFMTP